MRRIILAGSILLATGIAIAGEPVPRTLTFEDRVNAQEAIERVYYSHQIGTTKPFEQAVPRNVLENKVRKYLDETAALQVYWKTAVTDEMLQDELERMAHGTRMPERLLELYAALGNDTFLIKECLARPTVVDRLARDFYAFDPTLHAESRRRAEQLERQLTTGELSPTVDHPTRSLVEFVVSDKLAGKSRRSNHVDLDDRYTWAVVEGTRLFRHELTPDEFRKQLAQLPECGGHVPALKEKRDAFVLTVVLSETPSTVRVATFVIQKSTWEDWWVVARRSLATKVIPTVGEDRVPPPVPMANVSVDDKVVRLRENHLPYEATESWTPMSMTGMSTFPNYHTAVWTGSVMVVWGGHYTDETNDYGLNTGERYDPATDTWWPTSTIGAPSGRFSHTAVWTGSVMVVWGGDIGYTLQVNTGGRYDPVSDTWMATSTTSAPSIRSDHTVVWTGSVMIVWGGQRGQSSAYLDTGGRYDPATDTWSPTSTTNTPSGRYYHTAVWTGSEMVVWGGFAYNGSSNFFDSGGRYNPTTDTWLPTSTTGAPSGRTVHVAVWTGREMVVWGGYNDPQPCMNSGARYDPMTDNWTPIATQDAPLGRENHTAVWTGSEMVVWGGYNFDDSTIHALNTGGRYNPISDTWLPTSTTGAPSERWGHTAVWTGCLMLVCGGHGNGNGNGNGDVGGLYSPGPSTWFRDLDDDGYGDAAEGVTTSTCDRPPGFVSDNTDCDDADAAVHPGATEICNGINDNCNGQIDEGFIRTLYRDVDEDGYGDPNVTQVTCSAPSGWVDQAGDCDDLNPIVHVGATEVCDGIDDDCNGFIDEALSRTLYRDADNDGYGDPSVAQYTCYSPIGWVTQGGDCNDSNAAVHPGMPEICNAIDDNCNGQINEDGQGVDSDGDGLHNACDNCTLVPNPTQTDSDGDHVGNACDSCINTSNPSQADADGDARGDACDNCLSVPNGFQDDTDSDRVGDACDNCPLGFDPSQTDFNHDGEGDVCDLNDGLIFVYGTDDRNYVEWQAESGYTSWNSYRGSLAVLRATGQYTQVPNSNPLAARDCGLTDTYAFDPTEPTPGGVTFSLVTGVAGGVESGLGTNGAGVPRANANPCP